MRPAKALERPPCRLEPAHPFQAIIAQVAMALFTLVQYP